MASSSSASSNEAKAARVAAIREAARKQLDSEDEKKVISFKGQYAKTSWLEKIAIYVYSFVMVHYFLWIIGAAVVLYLLWVNGYWWVVLLLVAAYLPSFLDGAHKKLGRPWHAFRKSKIWSLTQKYLEIEVTREAKLDPSKQYLFGLYPHGILILSRVAMYGGLFDSLFPGIDMRTLGATPMFMIPGSREICLWMTAIDANKKTAIRALDAGKSLMVYPGGSKEIFGTDGDSKDTVLVLRKGFIKLALEHGTPLVPSFVFGEKWLYRRLLIPKAIQSFFMNTLRTPLIIFWGRFGITWLPLQKPLSVVFGKPIEVTKSEGEPTQQQIDELHGKFMEEIKRLFNTYKAQYGYSADEKLVFQEEKEKLTSPLSKKTT